MKRRLPCNWRQRTEITTTPSSTTSARTWRRHAKWVTYEIQFIKGRTPKGYSRQIGLLQVDECDHKWWVADVWLDDHFKGRGLGRLLYETALQKHGHLITNYHKASTEAQRVWRGLVKRYKHDTDFWKGTLKVFKEAST